MIMERIEGNEGERKENKKKIEVINQPLFSGVLTVFYQCVIMAISTVWAGCHELCGYVFCILTSNTKKNIALKLHFKTNYVNYSVNMVLPTTGVTCGIKYRDRASTKILLRASSAWLSA